MIKLGLNESDKLRVIDDYVSSHDISHVIVFSPEKFQLACDFEQYGWKDIIMYKVFYPLLEKIDKTYLLVANELLRTQNRSDLTYNCLHHYLNQTPHRLIFQYFPMIDNPQDFMILADCEHPGRYKGRGFSADVVKELMVEGIDRCPYITIQNIDVPESADAEYCKERDKLFANLGSKDPDTIPRQLHLYVAKYKRQYINPELMYIARNKRFKLPNVSTYADARDAARISIDVPHRRIDLNDYLFRSGADKIVFMETPLKIDKYYSGELYRWNKQAGEIYAQTSIHK